MEEQYEIIDNNYDDLSVVEEKVIRFKDVFGDLHPRHALFCEYYVNLGGNATAAYMKLYPSSKYSSASASATRLLRNQKIQNAIRNYYNYKKEVDPELFDIHTTLIDLKLHGKSEDERIALMAKSKIADIQLKLTDFAYRAEQAEKERQEANETRNVPVNIKIIPASFD